MESKMFCAYILILSLSLEGVNGYRSGPPINDGVCSSMVPGHKNNNSVPFNTQSTANTKLELNTSVTCYTAGGSAIAVNLQSFQRNGSSLEIAGIFIQAKKSGNTAQNYGRFEVVNSTNLAASNCFGNEKSALHHIAELGVKSITFKWIPPSTNAGDLNFAITLVHEYDEFWTNLAYSMPVCSASASINLSYILLLFTLIKMCI